MRKKYLKKALIFCILPLSLHALTANDANPIKTEEKTKMFIKNLDDGEKWIETPLKEPANKTYLTEMLHPQKDNLPIGYSLAEFVLPKGSRSVRFRLLKSSDAMYVLEGKASVEIDGQIVMLEEKQMLYIPTGASRCIVNTGTGNLRYLSIAEPEFKPEESEILEEVHFQKNTP